MRALIASTLVLVLWGTPAAAADLETFDALLRSYVRDGAVDYPAFAADPAFAGLIDEIAAADAAGLETAEQRLAFYINAYNALCIQSVLEGRSPATLLGRYRFFKLAKHAIAGESLSLYDIEHEHVLSEGDPRAHFALVCASRSCPPLRSELYRAEVLDEQLDEQAILFINDTLHNRFDDATKTAYVSKIFRWYRDDFETDDQSLGEYIAFYLRDGDTAQALTEPDYRIRFQKYDWSLNGEPPIR